MLTIECVTNDRGICIECGARPGRNSSRDITIKSNPATDENKIYQGPFEIEAEGLNIARFPTEEEMDRHLTHKPSKKK